MTYITRRGPDGLGAAIKLPTAQVYLVLDAWGDYCARLKDCQTQEEAQAAWNDYLKAIGQDPA